MHFSIPDTEEFRDESGSTYMVRCHWQKFVETGVPFWGVKDVAFAHNLLFKALYLPLFCCYITYKQATGECFYNRKISFRLPWLCSKGGLKVFILGFVFAEILRYGFFFKKNTKDDVQRYIDDKAEIRCI